MQAVLWIILTGISLGTIGMFVKLIDNNMHFMSVVFLRILIGFLFLLMFVPIIDKTTFKVKKSDIKSYALIGLVFALSLSLYTTSIFFTDIQLAALIYYSYPISMIFFAYVILKEKITYAEIFTILLAFIGLFIINPISSDSNMVGNILALVGSFTFALLIVLMRKEDKNHSIGAVVWFLGFAALFTLPFALYFGFEGFSEVYLYLIGLGLISTGMAYYFYNLGLEQLEAEYAAVITMIIVPLVSIILAVMIIGEELSFNTLLGGFFLFLGGIYLYLSKKINSFFIKLFSSSD